MERTTDSEGEEDGEEQPISPTSGVQKEPSNITMATEGGADGHLTPEVNVTHTNQVIIWLLARYMIQLRIYAICNYIQYLL